MQTHLVKPRRSVEKGYRRGGKRPCDPKLNVAELASLTGVANLILNLDAVISKE